MRSVPCGSKTLSGRSGHERQLLLPTLDAKAIKSWLHSRGAFNFSDVSRQGLEMASCFPMRMVADNVEPPFSAGDGNVQDVRPTTRPIARAFLRRISLSIL